VQEKNTKAEQNYIMFRNWYRQHEISLNHFFPPTSVLLGLQKWADRLGDADTYHKLSREAFEGRQTIKEACMIFIGNAYILRIISLLF